MLQNPVAFCSALFFCSTKPGRHDVRVQGMIVHERIPEALLAQHQPRWFLSLFMSDSFCSCTLVTLSKLIGNEAHLPRAAFWPTGIEARNCIPHPFCAQP